ncbi:pyruvate kinase [Butyrivibrio sp. VCD2006]|uniref:pyruvate kinase n=1 Tax=Butyrivibrio sp. VCD2006 TaxID=1280664 RepID=UPI00041607EF|nr:pyruvate kinase [Butyrivibrio sp. VCD2006]
MIDIFGTLGPSCNDEQTLTDMFRAGMTGVRLNLSHAMLHDNLELLNTVKKAASSVNIEPKLLIDLQGPELRIGDLDKPLQLKDGNEISVIPNDGFLSIVETSEKTEDCNTFNESRITVDQRVIEKMEDGDSILLDDGKILGIVSNKTNLSAKIIIKRGGILTGRKSILIENKTVMMPTLTIDDLTNLSVAAKHGITGVMLPFVRNSEDLRTLRATLDEAGGKDIEIYAKVENLDGVRMLPELIGECDEIVIARGDLGNAVPLWELPALQKRISRTCREQNKRFMVVTQMLSSMEHNPVPTRAEVSDIYNAAFDGATSVMVTGETAIGEFPVGVIQYLSNTVHEYEKNKEKNKELF